MLALVDEQVLAPVDDGPALVRLEAQEIAADLVGDVSALFERQALELDMRDPALYARASVQV